MTNSETKQKTFFKKNDFSSCISPRGEYIHRERLTMNNTYEKLSKNSYRLNFIGSIEELCGEINRLFNIGCIDKVEKANELEREAEDGRFSFIVDFVEFLTGLDALFFARMGEAEYRKISHRRKHGCGSEMDRHLRSKSLRWFREHFRRMKIQKKTFEGYEKTFSFSLPTVSAE